MQTLVIRNLTTGTSCQDLTQGSDPDYTDHREKCVRVERRDEDTPPLPLATRDLSLGLWVLCPQKRGDRPAQLFAKRRAQYPLFLLVREGKERRGLGKEHIQKTRRLDKTSPCTTHHRMAGGMRRQCDILNRNLCTALYTKKKKGLGVGVGVRPT